MLSAPVWHHSGLAGTSIRVGGVCSPRHWPRSDISWLKQSQACPRGCCILSCTSQTLSYIHGHSALWQCGGTTSSWDHRVWLGRQCGDPAASGRLLYICTERDTTQSVRRKEVVERTAAGCSWDTMPRGEKNPTAASVSRRIICWQKLAQSHDWKRLFNHCHKPVQCPRSPTRQPARKHPRVCAYVAPRLLLGKAEKYSTYVTQTMYSLQKHTCEPGAIVLK